jgi:GT2 family glycosyltransferase
MAGAAPVSSNSRPPESRPESAPFGVIVICTKDRPAEIATCIAAAHEASPDKPILIVDASATNATHNTCQQLTKQHSNSLALLYRRAQRPGLARQRNEAVTICRELKAQVVHFIDDDTEVGLDYFDAIERRFRSDGAIMGVGGIIVNQPTVNYVVVKSFFLLGSHKRGSVLRSGRNVLGQYPGTVVSSPVHWLSGCSMSFRTAVFDELSFDDSLTAYSMGEDYDFSYRVSRKHRLAVEPAATCLHHVTPTVRGTARTHARLRTEATHRWVHVNRALGMSPVAFWWSTLGDFLLQLVHGVTRFERGSLRGAAGVIDGVIAIVRRGLLDT